uniref:Alpha N-terminal protein methyltransferase 1 n=1 Tax=Macrostomum lignano TaxID=282301 RepID=A0A1I8FG86_9PLAT
TPLIKHQRMPPLSQKIKANNCDEAQQQEAEFYTDAERYWATVEATEAGMMGGNDSLDEIEISSSRIAAELAGLRQLNRALDCGSGIGRVTKKLLLPMFATVDMAEVTSHFLAKSQGDLTFPAETRYDLWVIGHLRDAHLVDFLRRAAASLSPCGMIGVKDNVITARDDSEYDFDEQDSSVCRPRRSLLNLFNQAGLIVLLEGDSGGLPGCPVPGAVLRSGAQGPLRLTLFE